MNEERSLNEQIAEALEGVPLTFVDTEVGTAIYRTGVDALEDAPYDWLALYDSSLDAIAIALQGKRLMMTIDFEDGLVDLRDWILDLEWQGYADGAIETAAAKALLAWALDTRSSLAPQDGTHG